MSMNVQSTEDEPTVMSEINTTPLVDIMLVLLIIFLITIPIITKTVPVQVAEGREHRRPRPSRKTSPSRWTTHGQIWWNGRLVPDRDTLIKYVVVEAVKVPQPEVHIRGDAQVRYEAIGRTLYAIQRGGLTKVGFITEPDVPLAASRVPVAVRAVLAGGVSSHVNECREATSQA